MRRFWPAAQPIVLSACLVMLMGCGNNNPGGGAKQSTNSSANNAQPTRQLRSRQATELADTLMEGAREAREAHRAFMADPAGEKLEPLPLDEYTDPLFSIEDGKLFINRVEFVFTEDGAGDVAKLDTILGEWDYSFEVNFSTYYVWESLGIYAIVGPLKDLSYLKVCHDPDMFFSRQEDLSIDTFVGTILVEGCAVTPEATAHDWKRTVDHEVWPHSAGVGYGINTGICGISVSIDPDTGAIYDLYFDID